MKLWQYHPKSPRKSRYRSFLALPNLTGFLYVVPNTLTRVVWANIFFIISQPSISPIFNKNIKQVICVEVPNLKILYKQYFAYSRFRLNWDFRNLSALFISNFLNRTIFFEFLFLVTWSIIGKRESKKTFQTNLIIRFCNFWIFYYRSDLPQVKQNLLYSITNLSCLTSCLAT